MTYRHKRASNSISKEQIPHSDRLDRQLWNSIKHGDTEALTTLFRRYYALLYEYAIKLGHRRDWAEDSVQEIFVYIWQKRESLTFAESIKSYLFMAVRNHVLNEIGREKRHSFKHRELRHFVPKDAFSPEEMLLFQETTERKKWIIERALKEITPRQRETLYLKIFSELSYKEIAPIMQISPQTARNYVSEAYQRLYKILSTTDILDP